MTCREVLKDIQWIYGRERDYLYCPYCDNLRSAGHSSDCELDAALKAKTVEVEIPEPIDGLCDHNCPMLHACKFSVPWKPGFFGPCEWERKPGPGCPWYGGESNG